MERETRLLDAAEALIIRYGYDKTTVDEIAGEAGVSKGAVYLHFKSKDDIFLRLIERESMHLLAELIRMFSEDEAGMNLFTIYRNSILAMMASPLLRALYGNDRRILGDWQRRLRAAFPANTGLSVSVEFVQGMQAAGMIRADVPASEVAAVMLAIRQGMLALPEAYGQVSGEEAPLVQVGEAFGHMLQQHYGTEHGDSEGGSAALRALFQRAETLLQETKSRLDLTEKGGAG